MDPQLIGTLVTGIVALLVGVMTARAADRKDGKANAQTLIDQLQEERDTAVARADAADDKHTAQLTEVLGRQRALENYVGQLRSHIDQRLDPPAPPWPAELMAP